ncbi:aldo/keto reductase [Microbacterium sp. NPDC089696]|uniref:aldo/keto reductase n=1 Tax=Microbacterium sp. NPDC089696 TaxID=3364199 RepID=UPI0038255F94
MSRPPARIAAGSGSWVHWNPASVGDDVSRSDSIDLVLRLFADPEVRVLDTANNYGFGASEERIGAAIREHGGVPEGFVIQTKADRDMRTGDFSGARIRRSLDESRSRLGLDTLPVVYLHDPENISWDEAFAADGPVAALVEAKDAGIIGALGVAGGPSALMRRYLDTGHFTALITHNRYTIADRSADRLLDHAHAGGVHVTNASPYGGGFLTAWPPPTDRYAYGVAAPSIRRTAERAAALCSAAGVPLIAAALAFSTQDPRIDRTIIGMRTAADLDATHELLAVPVDAALLDALRTLESDPRGWQDPVDDWL